VWPTGPADEVSECLQLEMNFSDEDRREASRGSKTK
jgi:hypothetical protein